MKHRELERARSLSIAVIGQESIDNLTKVGIYPSTAEQFHIHLIDQGKLAGHLLFPIPEHRTANAYGILPGNSKMWSKTPQIIDLGKANGRRLTPSDFNYHLARISAAKRSVIVVQHPQCVWWLWQHGYKNAFAWCPANPKHNLPSELIQILSASTHVYVLSTGTLEADEWCMQVSCKIKDWCPCIMVRTTSRLPITAIRREDLRFVLS